METLNHFGKDSVFFKAKFSTFEENFSLDVLTKNLDNNRMRVFIISKDETSDDGVNRFKVLISVNHNEIQTDVNFMYAFYELGEALKTCNVWMPYLDKCDREIYSSEDFDELVDYLKDKF